MRTARVRKAAEQVGGLVWRSYGRDAGINLIRVTFLRMHRERSVRMPGDVPAQEVTGQLTRKQLEQGIKCEEFALRRRYGTLPSLDAINRMRDTVYSTKDRETLRRAEERLPPTVILMISPRCAVTGPRAPEEINGASLITRAILRSSPRRYKP